MPDITMCNSQKCERRKTCKRNPASGTVPDKYSQSWQEFDAGGKCELYWPIIDTSLEADVESLRVENELLKKQVEELTAILRAVEKE